jgi:hypothetical protein
VSATFPAPTTPPTPSALLAWLGEVIEGAWVDDEGRRLVVRDVIRGTAYLDVVPPDGWRDVTQVRYLVAITNPDETADPTVCVRCCNQIAGTVEHAETGPVCADCAT